MMDNDEKSIEGFAFAEEAQQMQKIALQDDINAPLIPRFWIILCVLFLGFCLYWTGIDVLLLFWGKTTIGAFYQCSRSSVMGCNIANYVFESQNKKYNATVNYRCSVRTGCIKLRNKVTVNYVSWNPHINKASYDAYSLQ